MAAKKIGQRQAAYYRRRVMELERVLANQKQRWSSGWSPGWVNIDTVDLTYESSAKVTTARLLGHAVIIVPDGGHRASMFADKL